MTAYDQQMKGNYNFLYYRQTNPTSYFNSKCKERKSTRLEVEEKYGINNPIYLALKRHKKQSHRQRSNWKKQRQVTTRATTRAGLCYSQQRNRQSCDLVTNKNNNLELSNNNINKSIVLNTKVLKFYQNMRHMSNFQKADKKKLSILQNYRSVIQKRTSFFTDNPQYEEVDELMEKQKMVQQCKQEVLTKRMGKKQIRTKVEQLSTYKQPKMRSMKQMFIKSQRFKISQSQTKNNTFHLSQPSFSMNQEFFEAQQ